MNHDYADIRSRIPEPPIWWDENAVPRYQPFHPSACADIYAKEAVLALITCQGCGAEFHVAFSLSPLRELDRANRGGKPDTSVIGLAVALAEDIRDGRLHYGDPPNIGCCPSGPTMNSEPRRVLEYWRRKDFEWVRDSVLEIDITPDWVAP